MRIGIIGYRDWAVKLGAEVDWRVKHTGIEWLAKSRVTVNSVAPEVSDGFDVTFFVGWSDMVPKEYYTERLSLVLHPSPLPKYRGGSPLQHQIIDGQTTSAVTLFKLDEQYPGVDEGPIAIQVPFSLEGELSDILSRLTRVGTEAILTLLRMTDPDKPDLGLTFIPQHGPSAPLKRRKPEESEISAGDFLAFSARTLHNKIRALQDPYPLPFVTCGPDKRRLYILKTRAETDEEYESRQVVSAKLAAVKGGEVERDASSDGPETSERAPSPAPDDPTPKGWDF